MNNQQKKVSELIEATREVKAICESAKDCVRRGMHEDADQLMDDALRLNVRRRTIKRELQADGTNPTTATVAGGR